MNEKKTARSECPLCGDAQFLWLFEKKGRDFWRCAECGLEKLIPLPTEKELIDFYDNEYKTGLYDVFSSADEMKQMTARQRIKEITPYVEMNGKWIDLGCANGVFVGEAIKRGIDAEGIEISEVAVSKAKEKRLPVRCGSIDILEKEDKYDCITAFDLIEHLMDPLDFLEKAAGHLNPGGRLVITTPDRSSIFRMIMGKNWFFYMPDEHLYYFTPPVITGLLKKAGLDVFSIARTHKPLTLNYSLTQFEEYNSGIYRVLHPISRVLPKKIREWVLPVYIGEIMVVSRLQTV